jgi:hypothetical protein
MVFIFLFCLQEAPANSKESLEFVAEVDDKIETEEEEASEESSGPVPEIDYADKEIKGKTEHGESTGIKMVIENEPHVSSEGTAVEYCVTEETMAKESALPSSDKEKNGLCDTLSDSDMKSCTEINEEKYPKENIVQTNTCSYDDTNPEVNSIVMCDDKVMADQNVTEDYVESSSGVQKRKRGRQRKPTVQKNLETNEHGISTFSKIALNNELESLAQSFSGDVVFDRKQRKLARSHKKKLQSATFGEDTSINGLEKGMVKKKGRARKMSSAVGNELGFEVGEIHFQGQCGGNGGFGQETTEQEKESVDMITENMPSEVKADSSIEVQKMCNETKSSSTTVLPVNGIEATSVLILPVES